MKQHQLTPLGDFEGEATPDLLRKVTATLTAEGPRLAAITTQRIATRLALAAEAWLEPGSVWMQRAKEEGSASSGYSPQMLEWSLTELLRRFTPISLAALVESELGSLEPFQDPRSKAGHPCARSANPPQLVFQVLAGTVPPVGIEAIALSLLARAPLLLKTASEEPVIPRLFLESLRAVTPDLARHVAVLTWRGGDGDLDDAACAAASFVLAYGGDDAVNALMQRCRFPTRFQGYGHRVSFAVIGDRADDLADLAIERVAEDLALDAAAYDQRGCMSPHCVFVSHHARWSPEQVAEALAFQGFPAVAEKLARGRLDPAKAAEIQQARGVAEFTARVLPSTDALVFLHEDTVFRPSPGGRTLHVVPYDDDESLFDALSPIAGAISTVGLSVSPTVQTAFSGRLGRMGARRICRLGRMQRPIWLRDHDGRPRLGDWVDWTDVEPLY